MTHQEVFDKIAKHLLSQMKRATGQDGCQMISPEGYMCAVGCLLSAPESWNNMAAIIDADAEVAAKWRGNDDFIREPLHEKFFAQLSRDIDAEIDDRMLDLLSAAQTIHDEADPEDWSGELRDLALDLGLSDEVIKDGARP